MVFLGKKLNMSIVASMGYCIEVVGKEGQGGPELSSPPCFRIQGYPERDKKRTKTERKSLCLILDDSSTKIHGVHKVSQIFNTRLSSEKKWRRRRGGWGGEEEELVVGVACTRPGHHPGSPPAWQPGSPRTCRLAVARHHHSCQAISSRRLQETLRSCWSRCWDGHHGASQP